MSDTNKKLDANMAAMMYYQIDKLLSFFALQAYSYCILYHLYSLMSSKLLYMFKLITLNS